jgi:hypothetical protein
MRNSVAIPASSRILDIQPGRELLLLLVGQPAVATNILEAGERGFTAEAPPHILALRTAQGK